MTDWRDLDRVLDRWMDDGPSAVADRVIAAAMTDVNSTRQRGARLALLEEIFMTMKPAMTALGIAAVAIVAGAMYQLLAGGDAEIGAPPVITADDLPSIVLNSSTTPEGWTIDSVLGGDEALADAIRSDSSWGRLEDASAGYLDGRAVDFCTSGAGCGTSWVALYDSDMAAHKAFGVLAAEFRSGWNMVPTTINVPNDLGDERRIFIIGGMGPSMASEIYLWRADNLLLGVAGLAELQGDPLRWIAQGMHSRAR